MEKKQRVRVPKNRKKAWNKHCDISEVEEFLENKRFDERIGGAIADKSVDELCFVDTGITETAKPSKVLKKLKCFQHIGNYSQVPSPHTRTLRSYSKKIKDYLNKGDERRWKKIVAKSKEKKVKDERIIQKGDMYQAEIRDLWADEGQEQESDLKELIEFRDEYTKKRTPNVPAHRFQKPSLLPSVEVPHAGASYNPSFDKHQELLSEAVKIEEKKLKVELNLKRVLADMFPTRANAPTSESILAEMSQGLFDEKESEEEIEEPTAVASSNPPISAEDRLTKSRRRKRKEMKEEKRIKLEEKLQKKRLSEVFRMKSIKSKIKEDMDKSQQRQDRRMQRRIDKMYQPRTLSKHKYEAPDLEVNLSEELCGSMKDMKTEGNLLEDRYKSLQRRNLIEPRERQKFKRKYKLKKQIKRSHRNFK